MKTAILHCKNDYIEQSERSLRNDSFIRILSADKNIGLTATGNHILVPRKSVTAIIGITDSIREEKRNKCEFCSMNETCRLRKEGKSCGR